VQVRALALYLHGEDRVIQAAGRVLDHPTATVTTLGPLAVALMVAATTAVSVTAIDLVAGELTALRGTQFLLFGAAPDRQEGQRAALANLAASLGPEQLLRAALAPPVVSLAAERVRLAAWRQP